VSAAPTTGSLDRGFANPFPHRRTRAPELRAWNVTSELCRCSSRRLAWPASCSLEEWIALEIPEAPDLGNEDAGMPKEQSPGKPTTRRYSSEERAAPVRMVRTLRAELGTEVGTVSRVARQLGYGVESVRSWVRQADIDEGLTPGVSTVESRKVRELEQENRELKRANEILKRAASFFGAELDRQHKK